ncbi:MAG: FtsX-like permease family protein [Treponema sp.]|jgi:putative ABC transport system permease protein|nr:FtsX-like permease family protein [Treponema sp.]
MVTVQNSLLQKKILRDIAENRASFLAIICICSLGIALFSGINLYVSTIVNEVDRYYDEAALADYWIYKAEVSENDLERLRTLPYVHDAQRRAAFDAGLSGGSNATLRIHALETAARINIPQTLEGNGLDGTETDALLLDSRFAEAHSLASGDAIRLRTGAEEKTWRIQGIVRNVEYVYYAPEGLTIPDYQKYGFAYTNAAAAPEMKYNEIIVTVNAGVNGSPENIMTEIREVLDGANIISRQHQPSSRKIADSMTTMRQIGTLFSIAFFLTAALVTWITVSRIMENQRQHLGTLRSLGFSKREIVLRYSQCGILITLPSMIAGWLISHFLLARFLYELGVTYYTIDKNGVDTVSPHFFIASLCVALVTSNAAFFTCNKSLKNTPAALMRPKPPAKGHGILLERIRPYWRRLSFSGKIVTRNLFRNKTRLAMGLVGIIGSTLLILCGFGLSNSINAMLNNAFDGTIAYDTEIKLRSPLPETDAAALLMSINGAKNIDATMAFSVYVYGANGSVQTPYLVVMGDGQRSLRFTDTEGRPVALPADGACITPRMANALGVMAGDAISTERLDGEAIPLTVAAIVDFPVGNEIYISRSAFEKVAAMPFMIRTLLIQGEPSNIEALRADPSISLVETKTEMRRNMLFVLKALRSLQIILIGFAGLLAFAVMMVLGRLNYFERVRELATLKVLGFFQNEMKRLVLRENIWITIFGLPIGAVCGFALLTLILNQATTPDLEIRPFISVSSFLISGVLLFGFTLLVNYLMGRKFRHIDMVASLKSVE